MSKNPAKIFCENINTKTSKISKNFLILIFKQTQKTMKKFEFICKTDMITGDKVYLTREDGIYVSNSLRLSQEDAYKVFQKLSNQEPTEMFEVLETATSPTE